MIASLFVFVKHVSLHVLVYQFSLSESAQVIWVDARAGLSTVVGRLPVLAPFIPYDFSLFLRESQFFPIDR